MNFTKVPLCMKLLYLCVGHLYSLFAKEVTEAFLPRQCGIVSVLPSVRLNKWGFCIFSEDNNSLVVSSATSIQNLFIIWLLPWTSVLTFFKVFISLWCTLYKPVSCLQWLTPGVCFAMQIQRIGSSFLVTYWDKGSPLWMICQCVYQVTLI